MLKDHFLRHQCQRHFYKGGHPMTKVLQHAESNEGVFGRFGDITLNTISGSRHPHFRKV